MLLLIKNNGIGAKTLKNSTWRLSGFAVKKSHLRNFKTKNMKNLRLKLLIIGLFISIRTLIAQAPHPNFDSPPPQPQGGPCNCCPIDGGMSILIILSLTYGTGRIVQLNKIKLSKIHIH
jgi:hypothetical protein